MPITYNKPSNRAPRQSNMELLRIVAMFLILANHADFYSIGEPTFAEIYEEPLSSVTQIVIEFASIISVNVFVMISGWFGIRTTMKGMGKLMFQCAFFGCLVYFGSYIFGVGGLEFFGVLYAITSYGHWFVVSYLFLMLLAPMINAYIKGVPRQTFERVLAAYLVFLVFYGYFPAYRNMIAGGFSTMMFIGLYLLARYVSIYRPKICVPSYCFIICIVCILLNSIIFIFLKKYGTGHQLLEFINPLNILAASTLTFGFVGLRISYNRWINFVGASVFALYLLHNSNPRLYIELMQRLNDAYSGLGYILAAGSAITVIFIVAVILDQIRIFVWNILVGRGTSNLVYKGL